MAPTALIAMLLTTLAFGADPACKAPLLPHDTPLLRSRTRLYVALTNKCNRACPWCSVYSNPSKNTFLTPEGMARNFPTDRPFDVQLEGGEPTIHPQFFDFVRLARGNPLAHDLILVTNGVKLPKDREALKQYILRFGTPFKLKLSINHHLMERDASLIPRAQLLLSVFQELGGDREVIFNVRLRKGLLYGNDQWVRDAVDQAGLAPHSNIFFLQKYGLGASNDEWAEPFAVTDDFILLNPDGEVQYHNLIERSEAMNKLK
jgi:hypothetical protein